MKKLAVIFGLGLAMVLFACASEQIQAQTQNQEESAPTEQTQEAVTAESNQEEAVQAEQKQENATPAEQKQEESAPAEQEPAVAEEFAAIDSDFLSEFLSEQQKTIQQFCDSVLTYEDILTRFKPESQKVQDAEAKIRSSAKPIFQKIDEALAQRKADLAKFNENGLLETTPEIIHATEDIAWLEKARAFFAPEASVQELQLGAKIFPGIRMEKNADGVKYVFRWCPAGTFLMGYEDGKQHQVTLTKGFWMLETEVTQAMWLSVMGNSPSYFNGTGFFSLGMVGKYDASNHPVESVNWNDCQEFCQKLSKKLGMNIELPTEAQWEYACRAGTKTAFNFGGTLNGDKANCNGREPYGTSTAGTNLKKTAPAKSYIPNAWGLYDMHGNVEEWCQDWKGDYPSSAVIDPKGPDSGSLRICRGGSWESSAKNCRSAFRGSCSLMSRNDHVGFRVVGTSK